VDNAVVLARLFNEASGQKAPSKKHGLFISRPIKVNGLYFSLQHTEFFPDRPTKEREQNKTRFLTVLFCPCCRQK
ncbi:MAG: hypothetical protein ACI9K9_000286, partial [Neolewinella sp.]